MLPISSHCQWDFSSSDQFLAKTFGILVQDKAAEVKN